MHVVGLHVHLFTGWISPDGLPHGGLLEIKCPTLASETTVDELFVPLIQASS